MSRSDKANEKEKTEPDNDAAINFQLVFLVNLASFDLKHEENKSLHKTPSWI